MSGVPSREGPPRAAFRRQPREPATLGRERRLRQCPRPQDDKDPARGASPADPRGVLAGAEPPRSHPEAETIPGARTRGDRFRSATLSPLGAQGGGRHLGQATPRRPARMCHTQGGSPSDPGIPAFSETPAAWDPSPAPAPPPVRAREPCPTPGSQSGPGSPVRLETPTLLPVRPSGPPPGSGTPVRPRDPRPALGPQSGPGDPCPALGPQFGPGTPARLETPAPPWTQPGSGTPDSRGSPRPPETVAWP
nr:nascent polypeptide-associated complex subunit alpha, muscle-specific form-like [Odocoileus virginianus texanus]